MIPGQQLSRDKVGFHAKIHMIFGTVYNRTQLIYWNKAYVVERKNINLSNEKMYPKQVQHVKHFDKHFCSCLQLHLGHGVT